MISRWRRSAMMRSRPVKFILRAEVRARSRGRAVKSAMEKAVEFWVERFLATVVVRASSGSFDSLRSLRMTDLPARCISFRMTEFLFAVTFEGWMGMGMVTARDSGRGRRPLQTGQRVADMYCIMYSR